MSELAEQVEALAGKLDDLACDHMLDAPALSSSIFQAVNVLRSAIRSHEMAPHAADRRK